MDFFQFNWISGLDESGTVAVALFTIFFIIALITVVMIFRVSFKKGPKKQSNKESQNIFDRPPQPRTRQPAANTTEKKKIDADDYSDPIEEARVFLSYGLHKQAVDVLKKYLKVDPSNETAREMLAKAEAGEKE